MSVPAPLPSPVVVTGAAGFVGRHLVRALQGLGVEVVAAGGTSESPRTGGAAEPRRAPGDLADPAWRRQSLPTALAGARALVHLAAARERPGSAPARMQAVNEDATAALFAAAAAAGVAALVHVSTTRVFGPVAPGAAPHDETSPLVADDRWGVYPASRARAVAALRDLGVRHGLPLAILHAPVLFGPDEPTHPNRVTTTLRRALRGRPTLLVDGGGARRDLLHVDDLVAAILAALRRGDAIEAIVTGEPIGHRALVEAACLAVGRRPPLRFSLPLPLAAVAASFVDAAKGYDKGTGMQHAVLTLSREWRARSHCAERLLGHVPPPLAARLAQVARGLVEAPR